MIFYTDIVYGLENEIINVKVDNYGDILEKDLKAIYKHFEIIEIINKTNNKWR